jgi:serine/threonine protein kinase
MESSERGADENWLREFIAGAVGDSRSDEFETAARIPPPAWMELIGPSPSKAVSSIGPYRIDRRIGQGGMGVVFQAFDSALLRHVAIKFLTPRLAVSPLARARFSREGQAAAAIKHLNIVTIYTIGEYEKLPYLVMEYVDGITLADRLEREGMLERKSILRIGLQVAQGLAAAHSQGLVHRDVKPGNILLEGGLDGVKITDFGLACVTTEPWRLTASGVLVGTPAYMSPEQAGFSAVDHRSDLFSLGSVLYHLCTGEPPFPGPTLKSILAGVREAEPRPIRDLNPDIPVALEDVIRRLMAQDPTQRYQSAHELVRALADVLAEMQGRILKPSRVGQEQESRSPERGWAALQGSQLDLVDSWDDAGSFSRAKDVGETATLATSGLSIVRRALAVTGAAMVIATIAVGTISALPTWWREFGQDTPSILLLAFTGIAVFTWSLSQLVIAVRRRGAGRSSKRSRAGVLRNVLATAILIPTAGTAYLELSVYAQSSRALRAVHTRLMESINSPPLMRQEVERLIGRTAEDPLPGTFPNQFEVAYRWRGVFRTFVLRAKYVKLRRNMGDPTAKPAEGEEGFDTLCWISEVLE